MGIRSRPAVARRAQRARVGATLRFVLAVAALALTLVAHSRPAQAVTGLDTQLVQRVIAEVVQRVPLKDLTRLAVATTRRAVSLGPHVGVALGTGVPQGVDTPLSFGLTGVVFSNPMLSLDQMKGLAVELLEHELNTTLRTQIRGRLKGKVASSVFDVVRAGVKRARKEGLEAGVKAGAQVGAAAGKSAVKQLREADYEAIAREIWGRLSARLKARLLTDDTLLPSPKFGLWLAMARLPRSEAWQVRLGTGVGLSKLTLGPTLSVHTASPRSVALGLEATVNAHVGRGPRPWHLQAFARYEWFLLSHAAFGHQGAVGLRCVFDLL